ncbi:MAG TPA: pilus assembly protein PilM [Clostridiaceae bacterium]|nr:pilus assembly protein PilM [Clostridiaceae bacterium]
MLFRKFISIDIGSKKTKIVYGGVRKNTLEIIEYAIIDTPRNSIMDGKILDFQVLNEVLKSAFKENNIKGRHLLFIITGTAIITREVQIPDSSDEELAKILQFEAQQYFPVDLDSYIMDYRPLEKSTTPDGVFVKVQLIAVPQRQVDEYVKLADSLKKEITTIDISANCLNRFLYPESFLNDNSSQDQNPAEKSDPGIAVLDIGYETIGVSVFSKGILKFQRNLLNGFEDLANYLKNAGQSKGSSMFNLADYTGPVSTAGEIYQKTEPSSDKDLTGKKLNTQSPEAEKEETESDDSNLFPDYPMSHSEAAATKSTYIKDSENTIEATDIDLENPDMQPILAPAINSILADLQRFFDFYNTRSGGNKISKILLYGGGSKLKGLEKYIEQYYGIETSYLTFKNVNGPFNIVYKGKKTDFKECCPLLINAVGALIR